MAKVVAERILGPLLDQSYRVITNDEQVNEYVWGTCAYWAKRYRLTHQQTVLESIFEQERTADLFVMEEGEKRWIYPETHARKAVLKLQKKLEREALQVRLKIN